MGDRPFPWLNISIHAPREGGDQPSGVLQTDSDLFQSTPPARGATSRSTSEDYSQSFQSTPPARGATTSWWAGLGDDMHFNPRPPRGGRRLRLICSLRSRSISIHAPREGGDTVATCILESSTVFQSTPPARGATKRGISQAYQPDNFNPRPPRGGRPEDAKEGTTQKQRFQSTPPARGATTVSCRSSY